MRGSIVKRQGARGIRYHASWRANGKRHWKSFRTRELADAHLNQTMKAVDEGTYRKVKGRTLAEVFAEFESDVIKPRVAEGLLQPSTASSWRSVIKCQLTPAFGDVRSDLLTADLVDAWSRRCATAIAAGTLAKKTRNNVRFCLGFILQWARRKKYLRHDPLKDAEVKPLELDDTEAEFLEPDEVARLLAAATAPVDTLVHLGVFTGPRRGELCVLQWGDVDWGDGTVGRLWVRRALSNGQIVAPKTKRSRRFIDLSAATLKQLALHRSRYPGGAKDFIFATSTGRHVDPDNVYKRWFVPLLEAAGVRAVGLHALRHTFASLLIAQNESPKYISRQLGHASIAITMNTYGHLFKETSRSAMEKLSARIDAIAMLPTSVQAATPDRVM